jgi:hypothetical protein
MTREERHKILHPDEIAEAHRIAAESPPPSPEQIAFLQRVFEITVQPAEHQTAA